MDILIQQCSLTRRERFTQRTNNRDRHFQHSLHTLLEWLIRARNGLNHAK